jgi:O-antigen chain-terminating methyltransferase
MVLQCRRVLKKGAPLVLETVNPLSLFALSHIYFLDVTHHKPLHPEYMRYLVESSGFADVRILYADDPGGEGLMEIGPQDPIAREFNTNVDKLNKILFASPVYAVMGSKS